MEPKLKISKWTGDSGYRYTDINVSFNDTHKMYVIVEPNNVTNQYVVQHMPSIWDSHTTYMEALEKVAYLIINDLKKAGGHTNGKT